jgi:alkyl hydroperoxide reductase subunit D
VDKLKSLGISDEGINNLGKIVASLRGAKAAIEIESIRSYDFMARGSIF